MSVLSKLGEYQVLSELGRGGMGIVYRGRAPDGRDVAIKLLIKARDAASIARFEREGRLLGALGAAEGFVPLLDRGVSPHGPFLVMPFVPGGTLRDRLARGRLPVEDAVELGIDLARAVGKAHERGIVHRDLKPENVLFTHDGRPLVTDLGIAKHFSTDGPGASQSVALSRTGEMRGTAGYMAPEQSTDAKAVGPASDVFALGAILYECLSGEPAFEADSAIAVLAKVALGEREPLGKKCPEVPREIAAVVDRALSPEPAKRPQTGEELARALEAPATEEGTGSVGRLVLLGVAVVLVATVVGVLIMRGGGPSSAAPPPVPVSTTPGSVPAAKAVETPPPAMPANYRHLLRTRATRLTGLVGGFDWKHSLEIAKVQVLADGATAVSCAHDGSLRVWDVATGREKSCFVPAPPSKGKAPPLAETLAVAPNGKSVAVGYRDGRVRLWELSSGKLLAEVKDQEAWVQSLAFLPDGSQLLTGGGDRKVRRRTVPTLELLDVVEPGFVSDVEGIAVTQDGKRAFVVAGRSSVLIDFDLNTIVLKPTIAGGGRSLVLSRGGELAVSGCQDGTVVLLELASGTVRRTLGGHRGPVRGLSLSPDEHRLLTSDDSGTVIFWDLDALKELARFDGGPGALRTVAFVPGGRALTGSQEGLLKLWDLKKPRELSSIPGQRGWSFSLTFSPDGRRAAMGGGYEGSLTIWDLASARLERRLEGGRLEGVNSLAWSPDSRYVAAARYGGSVTLHDVSSDAPARRLNAHGHNALSVAFTPDGKLWSGADDFMMKVWRVSEILAGKLDPDRTLDAHGGWVTSIDVDPIGGRLLTSSEDKSVKLWDLDGLELAQHKGHMGVVRGSRFVPSPIGAPVRAFSCDTDGALRVWDLTTGTLLSTLREHTDAILRGATTTDGSLAATTALDATVRLWDTRDWRVLDVIDFEGTGDMPLDVQFAGDGRAVYVSTRRGVALRFELLPR